MGLDISAYEFATPVPEPNDRDAAYDEGLVQACDSGFPDALGSIVSDAWYQTSGETFEFRAGSYSGYNEFRRQLSQAALGVAPDEVWAHSGKYQDGPFFFLIDFSDCEGTIGPEICARLAAEFASERERVLREVDAGDPDWFKHCYDNWQSAFELAAGGGFVDFH